MMEIEKYLLNIFLLFFHLSGKKNNNSYGVAIMFVLVYKDGDPKSIERFERTSSVKKS